MRRRCRMTKQELERFFVFGLEVMFGFRTWLSCVCRVDSTADGTLRFETVSKSFSSSALPTYLSDRNPPSTCAKKCLAVANLSLSLCLFGHTNKVHVLFSAALFRCKFQKLSERKPPSTCPGLHASPNMVGGIISLCSRRRKLAPGSHFVVVKTAFERIGTCKKVRICLWLSDK